MGISYSVAKESNKVWVFKIHENGDLVHQSLHLTKPEALKELKAHVTFEQYLKTA